MSDLCPAKQRDQLSQILRMVADPSRIAILQILGRGEQSVTRINMACGLTRPTLSRHLSQLRTLGLVNARRKGRQIMYSLGPQFQVTQGCISLDLPSGCLSMYPPAQTDTAAAA